MHIALVGPVATADLLPLLEGDAATLPAGYAGAPMLVTLIAELLERGHRVTAITTSDDLPLDWRRPGRAEGANLAVVYVPMRRRAWRPNGWRAGRIVDLYAFELRGLQHAIEQAAPDVIHAHWSYEFAWAAVRAGLPHVVTCHDSPLRIARISGSPYRWLKAGMAWHVLKRARRVTTVSPYMLAQVEPLCRVPVSVVPNPVSIAAPPSQRPRHRRRPRVIMICNGWVTWKNPEPALRGFALLANRLPDAELVAVGGDFEPGGIAEQWWLAQGLRGRVSFRGPMPHDSVLALLAECDVLLHSSLEESFGVVVAEAMAVGLPVVAGADSGAVPWVVGEAGRLVDVRQPEAIADALECLFADPELAEKCGELGRKRFLEHFGAPTVAAAYEHEYLAALADAA